MLHLWRHAVTPRGMAAIALHLRHQLRQPVCGLRMLVLFVVMLNLLDAVFTVVWVEAGVAEEANVLLEGLLARSTVAFMVAKLAVVSAGVHVLWNQREHRLALGGLGLSCAVYGALLVYHLAIVVIANEFP